MKNMNVTLRNRRNTHELLYCCKKDTELQVANKNDGKIVKRLKNMRNYWEKQYFKNKKIKESHQGTEGKGEVKSWDICGLKKWD